jgi:hypothetical protein
MKKLFLLSCIFLLSNVYARSQGCIPLRQVAGFGSDRLFDNIQPADKWLLNVTNRYFEASTTFRGKEYVTDTLVRNRIYTLDLSVMRLLNNGLSLALSVPISANARKNSGDHGGPRTPKHTTRSFGLGDMRFAVYKWVFNRSAKGNIQAGLGLKLPTGDYRYQDYFFRNDTTKVLAPVDQAIQLGDGGTGITTELNAYYSLNEKINLFAQAYYLINPREQNGVSNLKGRKASPIEIQNTGTEMSVPDQYSIRCGANFNYYNFVLTTGLRFEGVPVEDLIGGSKGFRRAGFIASVEPGITYSMKKALAYVHVAVPFERRSIQSVPDKITTGYTGNYTITQGGFADYLVFVGVSLKL